MKLVLSIRVLTLLAACASVSACGTKAGQTSATSTGTGTNVGTTSDDSTATATATTTATVTDTVISASTVTATMTETATLVSTVTVVNTSTVTVSSTVSVTATATITATATTANIATVTATATVTQTSTVTATATNTEGEDDISHGTYTSESCFMNALASEGMGQKIFTRSSIHLNRNGRGENRFTLYEDSECRKELMNSKAHFHYSATKHFDRLHLLSIDQYEDPKNKKSLVRYWIPALIAKGGMLLDIDAARGARGPYLEEPSEEELKSLLGGMEDRAVMFKKK